MSNDIRWKQRYANFQKALMKLEEAVDEFDFDEEEEIDEVHRAGMIQFFEMSVQLAWNTLQDILKDKGYDSDVTGGPKPVIRQSFADGYITDDAAWFEMLKDRNESTHIYDEGTAIEISVNIRDAHLPLLDELDKTLAQLPDTF